LSPLDVAKILAVARGELGVVELTGHNDHPRITMYLNNLDEPDRGASPRRDVGFAWCAAWVLWVFRIAGFPFRGNFWEQRAVGRLYSDAIEWGANLLPTEKPAAGDLAIWREHESAGASGHVAIISEVSERGDIRTIGGNQFIGKTKLKQGVSENWLNIPTQMSIRLIVRSGRMLK
jgi:uncharacterized protein (TIGR02594 family)